MKKQTKTKIGVGSVVKAKVGELGNIIRKRRSRRMRKEVVGCIQSEVGKNNFPRPIRIWAEERDKFFFSCVFKFRRGG